MEGIGQGAQGRSPPDPAQRILDGDLSAVPDTWTVTLHDNEGKELTQAQIGAIRARQLEARRRGVRPPLSAEAQEIRNRREWFKARIEKLRIKLEKDAELLRLLGLNMAENDDKESRGPASQQTSDWK